MSEQASLEYFKEGEESRTIEASKIEQDSPPDDIIVKESLVTTKKTFLNDTYENIKTKQNLSKREVLKTPAEEVKGHVPFNSAGEINPFLTI